MSKQFSFSNSPAFAALGDDARKAMTTAFEAMSDWREQLTSITERNNTDVFDKMSAAAKAMGWPAEFVDLSRQQMENASKMQAQFMDQVMSTWEQQLKNPGSAFKMPGMDAASNLYPFPGASGSSPFGTMPGFGNMPANPFQFWMQAADMWQKSCQQAMQTWTEPNSSGSDQGKRR